MTAREKVNLKIAEINFPSPPGVCMSPVRASPNNATKYIHKQKVENRKWNKTGANLINVQYRLSLISINCQSASLI